MPEPHHQVVTQMSPREAEFEHQWRAGVSASLAELAKGQTTLASKFSDLREDNAQQHGQVETQIGRLETKVSAIDKRIDELLTQAKDKIDDANRGLEARNKIIKVLGVSLVALLLFMGGVKAHALGWVKDFWP